MSIRTNSQFVAASLTEFLSVWSLGGEASLNLTTRDGLATVKFNCTLGHPCAIHSLPPSPTPSPTPARPPHRPRHRGPSERERNKQRAARHQEARTAALASSSPSSGTGSVIDSPSPFPETGSADKRSGATDSVTKTTESEADTSIQFQCDKCNFTSNSDHGVKVHKGTKHKETQQPEQFRAESLDHSLTLTPVKEPKEEYSEETNSLKKEEEPVIFKMLDNGYAETKKIAHGETPPARVYHPELGIGSKPRQTKWGDRVWIEYVFEVDNVEMEMYQVI